jgi:hypothetical protein
MKLSQLEGKTLRVDFGKKHSFIAILREIRPIGFYFEVTSSESARYKAGQYVFLSVSCPVIFSTL